MPMKSHPLSDSARFSRWEIQGLHKSIREVVVQGRGVRIQRFIHPPVLPGATLPLPRAGSPGNIDPPLPYTLTIPVPFWPEVHPTHTDTLAHTHSILRYAFPSIFDDLQNCSALVMVRGRGWGFGEQKPLIQCTRTLARALRCIILLPTLYASSLVGFDFTPLSAPPPPPCHGTPWKLISRLYCSD